MLLVTTSSIFGEIGIIIQDKLAKLTGQPKQPHCIPAGYVQ